MPSSFRRIVMFGASLDGVVLLGLVVIVLFAVLVVEHRRVEAMSADR